MAKRLDNLITEERITIDFCKKAIYEASATKRSRDNVKRVLVDIDTYAETLRDMILNETFEPSPYGYELKIEHGKERRLQKPRFFPDQAVHHILIMLIRDKIISRIDPHAIASIPHRGQAMGIRLIQKWVKEDKKGCKHVIKGDIKKCFDSVKPKVIMDLYRKFIKDEKYLRLKAKVTYSCESLPLGNYCSAYDMNLLLKPMDEAVRKVDTVKHYIRYMDDFVVFCSNKRKAKEVKAVILRELCKIRLTIKENYQMYKFSDRGLDFIGYRFFDNYVILRKRNYYKILRQMASISKMGLIKVKEAQSIISRLGQCVHCLAVYIINISKIMLNLKLLIKIISDNTKFIQFGIRPSVILF